MSLSFLRIQQLFFKILYKMVPSSSHRSSQELSRCFYEQSYHINPPRTLIKLRHRCSNQCILFQQHRQHPQKLPLTSIHSTPLMVIHRYHTPHIQTTPNKSITVQSPTSIPFKQSFKIQQILTYLQHNGITIVNHMMVIIIVVYLL